MAVSVPFLLARFFHHDVAERAMSESRLVERHEWPYRRQRNATPSLLAYPPLALPQLIHKYSKNLLTHGEEFLQALASSCHSCTRCLARTVEMEAHTGTRSCQSLACYALDYGDRHSSASWHAGALVENLLSRWQG